MASGTQWRWVDRKGVQRVLTTDALHAALRAGVMGRDVPLWHEGMDAFEPAGRIPELAASCQHAPASTPVDVTPMGTVAPATPASRQALQQMISLEKSGRMPASPVSARSPAPSTVPPPRNSKQTVRLGSTRPLPPSPLAPPPRVPTGLGVPPQPVPEIKTSPAAMTIGIGMATPDSPMPSIDDRPEDTPPATPIAINASGRRSSPNQLGHAPAVPPQGYSAGGFGEPEGPPLPTPPMQPPVQPPARAARDIPTVPPSRMEMTQPSVAMRTEFERRLANERRMRFLIPVVGVVVGIVAIVMLGLVIKVVMSKDGSASAPVATSVSAEPVASASATVPEAEPEPPPSKPAVACVYKGPLKRLVVGASKDVPLEVWSASDESQVAVGFAARNQTGLGFVLDPKTVSPQRSFSKKVVVPLKRVVPVRSGKTIGFETDVDDPEASVRDTLTVATTPPVRLGTFKNSLTIGKEGEALPEILWQLPFKGRLEAMRAIAVPTKGLGLVFREQSTLWLGWVGEDGKPIGDLHKIPGTGVKVGTPSIGWNGREALITFANLEAAKKPWTIRMARVQFGEPAQTSFEWAVPAGGPGGAAIAPNIRGMHDGRWLMVWTEGKSGSRSVRAQTYDTEMLAVGEAFTVSKPGSNAGQGMAVVGKDGGVVLYLAVIGDQYEVWGAGIECP